MKQTFLATVFLTLIFACVALGILTYVPDSRIREALAAIVNTFETTTRTVTILAGVAASLALVAGLGWLVTVAWANGSIWLFNAQIKGAEALRAKREAGHLVTVAAPGSQVYFSDITESGLTVTHKPGHLSAGWINGQVIEWTMDEVSRWGFFQVQQSINRPPRVINAPELPAPELAPLPGVVNLREYVSLPSLSSVFLGVGRLPNEVNPRPIIAPFDRLVHVACGGSSGFGKSTFMQSVAWQCLNSPGSRPVLCDAQGVTFSPFEGHPALLTQLASEPKDIEACLGFLLGEMEKRKQLYLKHQGVAKLSEYNKRAKEALPVIPVFLDEFGLLADNRRVTSSIRALAQGGRKFGLYLVLGSQTWLASQFPTSLRSNLSTSVQFAARDKQQSRILLESSDAAEITIPGRAYAKLPGVGKLIELQAPIVDEAELRPVEVIALPDPATARALAMQAEGKSLSAIAKELICGGKRDPNGRDLRRAKMLLGILDEHDNESDKATTPSTTG